MSGETGDVPVLTRHARPFAEDDIGCQAEAFTWRSALKSFSLPNEFVEFPTRIRTTE